MTWLGPRSPRVRAAGSCSATVKPDRPSMLSRQSSDSTCSRADSPCSVMESPTIDHRRAGVGPGGLGRSTKRVARMTMVARIAEETSPNSTATSQMRFGPPSAAPLLAVPVTGGQPTGPPVAGSIRLVVSPAHPSPTTGLPTRARLAVATGRAVAGASKLVHFGSGSVIGGRAALLVDRDLLRQLTRGREVVIVSATNGKTTTTRLLGAALGTDRPGRLQLPRRQHDPRASSPPSAWPTPPPPRCSRSTSAGSRTCSPHTGAGTVVLLNLSRDQLDRTQEVRKLAERWRRALTATPPTPGRGQRRRPARRVGGLGRARGRVGGAPARTGTPTPPAARTARAASPSSRGARGAAPAATSPAPTPDVWRRRRREAGVVLPGGARSPLDLGLPGRVNRVNAAFALAAADGAGRRRRRGRRPPLGAVTEVAGRYRVADARRAPRCACCWPRTRPGWHEAIDLLAPAPRHRSSWPSTPASPTATTRRGCGTSPSSASPAASSWPPASAATTSPCASATPRSSTSPSPRSPRPCAGPPPRPGTSRRGVDVAANYTAFQEYLDHGRRPR